MRGGSLFNQEEEEKEEYRKKVSRMKKMKMREKIVWIRGDGRRDQEKSTCTSRIRKNRKKIVRI